MEREPVAPGTRYRPLPSPALPIGAGLAICTGIALICGLVALARTENWVSRSVALVVTLMVFLLLMLFFVQLWRLATLTYVFTPTALEARAGAGRIRVRYDQIERITPASSAPDLPTLTLWPGAYLGCIVDDGEQLVEWRATRAESAQVILISWSGRTCAISPVEPITFGHELVRRAREAPFAPSLNLRARSSWLDGVAGIDLWVRVLATVALWLASVVAVIQISGSGTVRPTLLISLTVLIINVVVAIGIGARWRGPARLLLVIALVAMALSVIW